MTDRNEVLAAATRRARALASSDEPALRELLHHRFGWISHRGASFTLDTYLSANARGEIRWQAQELRHRGHAGPRLLDDPSGIRAG